jgi:HEXXH motif-containing protein
MILRVGSEDLIAELSDELAAKTLEIWKSHYPSIFDHYVPWMSVLPTDVALCPHSALHHRYEPGQLLISDSSLLELDDYLHQGEGIELEQVLATDLPSSYSIAVGIQERQQWAEAKYKSATSLVAESHPYFKRLFHKLVQVAIPIYIDERKVSASSDLARGAVFIAFDEADKPWDIAVSIAHEMGHQALMVLHSVDLLIDSDLNEPVFSGVRLIERPAVQSLHAASALAFMLLFVTSCNYDDSARISFADSLRHQLQLNLVALRSRCKFSELGQSVIDDFSAICEK